ncbi:MAG: O-antigen ligase family protein, partial [Candidatus Omnitrophica bacterium]|nr:O-antigen ligase family protein [Candidatus Omnitrophota bacterium]
MKLKILEIMMNKKRLILYCDRVILASLCLLIFWLPISKAVAESFTLLAFVFWVLKRVFRYRAELSWGTFPKTGLNVALGIYILINALAVIFSTNFGLSLRAFFGKELKFLAIYFMLVEVANSRERLKHILIAIISSAVLVIMDAVVQYYRGVDFLMGYRWDRLTASFSTANGFAGWLIVIIPLFLGLLLAGKVVSKELKACLMVLTALLSVCLLVTYARGAWLGFIMAIVLMVGYLFKDVDLKIKLLCLFAGVGVLSVFLVLPQSLRVKAATIGRIEIRAGQTVNARIKSTLKINEGSTPIRLNLWKEALRIIRDYPLAGCGLNTYSIVA